MKWVGGDGLAYAASRGMNEQACSNRSTKCGVSQKITSSNQRQSFANHSKGLLSCSSTIIFADVARSGEW